MGTISGLVISWTGGATVMVWVVVVELEVLPSVVGVGGVEIRMAVGGSTWSEGFTGPSWPPSMVRVTGFRAGISRVVVVELEVLPAVVVVVVAVVEDDDEPRLI